MDATHYAPRRAMSDSIPYFDNGRCLANETCVLEFINGTHFANTCSDAVDGICLVNAACFANGTCFGLDIHNDTRFDNDLAIGLFFVGEIGLFSALMALGLFIYLAYDVWKVFHPKENAQQDLNNHQSVQNRRRKATKPTDSSKLQPLSIIFMLAIFMDIFQGLGSFFDMLWAFHGRVIAGTSECRTQGIMQQIGNDGAAWCTIWISILTLYRPPRGWRNYFTMGIVAQIFLFLLLIILIPATTLKSYYGDTSVWCWIQTTKGDPYTKGEREGLRIGSEYVFFWAAGLISLVCYGITFYRWLTEGNGPERDSILQDVKSVGWWPIAYIIQITPISIVRFIQFNNKIHIGRGWIVCVAAIFALSGMVNVSLWLVTGRRFRFDDKKTGSESDSEDIELTTSGGATPRPGSAAASGADGYETQTDMNQNGMFAGTQRLGATSRYPYSAALPA